MSINTNNTMSQEIYFDMASMETLKAKGRGAEKDDALMAAAQQFEAIFMNMAMKAMRDANESFGSEQFSSYETKFFEGMYDNQMSLSLSSTKGTGLADIIYQQLSAPVKTRSKE